MNKDLKCVRDLKPGDKLMIDGVDLTVESISTINDETYILCEPIPVDEVREPQTYTRFSDFFVDTYRENLCKDIRSFMESEHFAEQIKRRKYVIQTGLAPNIFMETIKSRGDSWMPIHDSMKDENE